MGGKSACAHGAGAGLSSIDRRVLTMATTRLRIYRAYVQTSRITPSDVSDLTLTPAAEQFVDFYYKTFDSDRTQLAALYVG